MTPFRSRLAAWRLGEYADCSLNDPPQTGDNTAKDCRRDHVKYPGSPVLTYYLHHNHSLRRQLGTSPPPQWSPLSVAASRHRKPTAIAYAHRANRFQATTGATKIDAPTQGRMYFWTRAGVAASVSKVFPQSPCHPAWVQGPSRWYQAKGAEMPFSAKELLAANNEPGFHRFYPSRLTRSENPIRVAPSSRRICAIVRVRY